MASSKPPKPDNKPPKPDKPSNRDIALATLAIVTESAAVLKQLVDDEAQRFALLSGQLDRIEAAEVASYAALAAQLDRIEAAVTQPVPPPSTHGGFMFHVLGIVARDTKQGECSTMLEVTASETEKARIKVVPVDANGKPSKIQAGSLTVVPATTTGNAANPVVTMESDDTFTVQADLSPEGASANSFTEFDVTGDADVGEGVEPLTDRIKLNVSSSKATNLGLTSVEVVPR